MQALMEYSFANSLYLTPCFLLYFALIKIGEKKHKASLHYFLGIMVMCFYIFPVRLMINIPIFASKDIFMAENGLGLTPKQIMGAEEEIEVTFTTINGGQIIILVFIIGILVSISFRLIKHISFLNYVNRWKELVLDESVLETLRKVSDEIKIKKTIELYECPGISSPVVIGLRKPYIILPDRISYEDGELYLIIKHELVHIKRKDILVKYFCTIVNSLYWFNPLVYILKNSINLQCELSCDEIVLRDKELTTYKTYGLCIIKAYQNSFTRPVSSIFSSKLNSNKVALKIRIHALTQRKAKKISILVPVLLLVGLIISTANLTIEKEYSNKWAANFKKNIQTYQQEPLAKTPEDFAPFLGVIEFEYTFFNGKTQINRKSDKIGVSAYEAIILKEIDVYDKSQLDALAQEVLERSIKAKDTIDIGYTYTYTVKYPEQIDNIIKEKYLK